jgi:hypothetical protein
MERDLDDLIKEGKEFYEMNRQYKYNKFPSAGTPAYLVSKKWLKKYKQYILLRDIKLNRKPNISENHC